jgi:hypothetical protein
MDPNINPPRVQSWNVTLEKQLGTNWSATVNYLGRYSDHLWAEEAINPACSWASARARSTASLTRSAARWRT